MNVAKQEKIFKQHEVKTLQQCYEQMCKQVYSKLSLTFLIILQVHYITTNNKSSSTCKRKT